MNLAKSFQSWGDPTIDGATCLANFLFVGSADMFCRFLSTHMPWHFCNSRWNGQGKAVESVLHLALLYKILGNLCGPRENEENLWVVACSNREVATPHPLPTRCTGNMYPFLPLLYPLHGNAFRGEVWWPYPIFLVSRQSLDLALPV